MSTCDGIRHGNDCQPVGATHGALLIVGFIALLFAGAGFLAVISATNTAVQIIVADSMRGRVLACRTMSFTLAYAIGGLIQGQFAEWFGPRVTVGGAGAVLLAFALFLSVRPALLAHLDDPPDSESVDAAPGATRPALS